MRGRLIELLKQIYFEYSEECVEACEADGYGIVPLLEEFFADNLLANGFIVPPVKVGQTVWFIRPTSYKKEITETKIEKIVVKSGGLYLKLACNAMYETSCNSIGKTVFLTREEAEKALAERSENND